ncbi:MAG: hypothetical protein IT501_01135 [Rubrivivax sp.]|nr:hypothetical protein [Rubrivivax sp.]
MIGNLRRNLRARLWVLCAFVLVVSVGSAAPWFAQPVYGAVCSSATKAGLAATGEVADHLDCALCLPLDAPPARTATATDARPATPGVFSHAPIEPSSACRRLTPPARAPPSTPL